VKLHFPQNAEAAVGKFIPKVPNNQFYLIFWEGDIFAMGSSLIMIIFIALFGLAAYGIWRAYLYNDKLKQEIIEAAAERGWTYEAGPNSVIGFGGVSNEGLRLCYRIETAGGAAPWTLEVHRDATASTGTRYSSQWSSDSFQRRELAAWILERRAYDFFKSRAGAMLEGAITGLLTATFEALGCSPQDACHQLLRGDFLLEPLDTPFAAHFVMLTGDRALGARLLDPAAREVLLAWTRIETRKRTGKLQVFVGMPNLRISYDGYVGSIADIDDLVKIGTALARNIPV